MRFIKGFSFLLSLLFIYSQPLNVINTKLHSVTLKNDDDTKIDKLVNFLNDYNLALYGNDVKEWDDPILIQKRALEEIKLTMWYLSNDIIDFDQYEFDDQKIEFIGGYKLNRKEKNLQLKIKYNNSKSQWVKFSVWKATRQQVMDSINEQISQLYKKEYHERDWKAFSFISSVADKYLDDILNKIGDKIKVKDEEILINKNRIVFNQSDFSNKDITNSGILKYTYLDQIDEFINLKINLINKLDINKIFNPLIEILKKQNQLSLDLKDKITWNQIEEFKIKFSEVENNLINYVNLALKLLKYEDETLFSNIAKISPIGPFENEVIVYFRINNSSSLIPFTIKFNNNISDADVQKLSVILTEKFSKVTLNKNVLEKISDQNLLKLIQKTIANKIIWNNEEVNFNSENLTIVSRTEFIEDDKTFLKLDLKTNIINLITIKIQLI